MLHYLVGLVELLAAELGLGLDVGVFCVRDDDGKGDGVVVSDLGQRQRLSLTDHLLLLTRDAKRYSFILYYPILYG
jgi:hypothetical protein